LCPGKPGYLTEGVGGEGIHLIFGYLSQNKVNLIPEIEENDKLNNDKKFYGSF
jgi:hypothetical protein